MSPFSSDESRIRRRCVGGQLALVTRTVADLGVGALAGRMYTRYRKLKVNDVLVFPEGVSAKQAAAAFRQSVDGTGHALNDATQGAHGPRAHRCRIQPGSDAQQAMPCRRR